MSDSGSAILSACQFNPHPNSTINARFFQMRIICFALAAALAIPSAKTAAQESTVSNVWVSDLGNGRYRNPVLNADYSDPDACRVGDDFYMTASSFDAVPGLPILHSRDLVNWELIGHALHRQPPYDHFSKVQHGNGVWAPAIRYHDNQFWIYYPDPDFGIYLIKAKSIKGPWSTPRLVEAGKGLIDPCPLWDDDGKVYLVHGYAGSRAGIKSVISVKEMNEAGTRTVNEGMIVFDGHEQDPTLEGPKFYKRNGWYYIFAPAGGVSTGWQLVLRSRNVYGPYERKVVMDQGKTRINGPHQGAWVDTRDGKNWFLHFQDKGVYGRVVHLQPMTWKADWPVIGEDPDDDGVGQPVLEWQKPVTRRDAIVSTPPESDEFNALRPGLQWQWQANPSAIWSSMTNGALRLYSWKSPDTVRNLWDVPNLLLQKTPADVFTATASLKFTPNAKLPNEETGLVVMGRSYARLFIRSSNGKQMLMFGTCKSADKGKVEQVREIAPVGTTPLQLRVRMEAGGVCTFSYLEDGAGFREAGRFQATEGQWIGAKLGLFCTRDGITNDSGYADYDWFRITP
jgi:beta-xylosidase